MTVALSPHVHWVQVEDLIFLLDERRGEYFGLDGRAAQLWPALIRGEPSGVAADDDVLATLRQSAQVQGWLIAADCRAALPPSEDTLGRQTPGALTWVGAYGCLLRAFVSLKWRGFARTYAWARSALAYRAREAKDAQGVSRGTDLFRRAESLVMSRRGLDDCLPRSLALFVYLRRAGIPVRHHIGVRCYPFAAHAWVEHERNPLLDRDRRVDCFTSIATIG